MRRFSAFAIGAILYAAAMVCALPAAAQEAAVEPEQVSETSYFADIEEWRDLTRRIEAALLAKRASSDTLEELRAQVVSWQSDFSQRATESTARIATLTAQMAALGDAPAEGAPEEDSVVAQRRAALSDQLSVLTVPAQLAREAEAQADGLISEIDQIIRQRRTEQLSTRQQSPLDPTGWGQTGAAIGNGLRLVWSEIKVSVENDIARDQARSNTPVALMWLIAAGLLILRGNAWSERVEGLITARTRRGRGVWRFLVSLCQIILPYLGILCLLNAVDALGLLGRRGDLILASLVPASLLIILGHWIARLLIYPPVVGADAALSFAEESRPRAATLIRQLGYVLALTLIVLAFVDATGFDSVPRSVVIFGLGLILALVLVRLARLLLGARGEEDAPEATSFRTMARKLLGRALFALALVGIIAGALGYIAVFELLIFPAATTLYLFAILVILQRLSVDVYTLLSSIENGAQEALIPVLIGFGLALLSLPVLALIWGARVADLTGLWARFKEGLTIGETQVSPTDFLAFVLVFVVGYTLTRLVQGALRGSILPRTRLDIGGQNAITAGVGYLGIVLAAIVAITTAGIDLSGLAIVAGALSVGIGFGLQNIVSNFVSGIILLIERPISQGDWIEVGGQMGYVRDISVRSTRIETFDRTDVIIPNADLVSGQVTNWTRGNSVGRVIVPVGVAYGTDTDRVAEILLEIAKAHPMVVLNPAPSVVFQGFGADSLDFEIRAILRDVNWVLSVKSDMNHAIAKRFTEEDIEIPFAQRDLWLRNPEVLGPQRPGEDE